MKTTAGIAAGSNDDVLAEDRLDRDAAFVRRLVREHRLAGDVADRVERRLGRAAARVDLDEPALIDFDLRLVEARPSRWACRPTDTSTFSNT